MLAVGGGVRRERVNGSSGAGQGSEYKVSETCFASVHTRVLPKIRLNLLGSSVFFS